MKLRSQVHILVLAVTFLGVNVGKGATDQEGYYEGYKVLSVFPSNQGHLDVLENLAEEFDFWVLRPKVFEENVLSVSPKALDGVIQTLKEANVSYTIKIENLQRSIDRERAAQNAAVQLEGDLGPRASFQRYMTYDEIVNYANSLTERAPERVRLDKIGKTVEGREIIAIRLSSSFGVSTPGVFVEAGIHAREWISPATALYLIDQIALNDTVAQQLLYNLNWYIVPVANPDGYQYTHTNPNDRFWVKNRFPTEQCFGVDLNKNFDIHWKEFGGSWRPCDETYFGSAPFSEAETRGLRDYIVENASRINMYLSLHSFGYAITYPWGYTETNVPDVGELKCIGDAVNKAMKAAGSPKDYTVGTSHDVIGAVSGMSADWVKAQPTNIRKVFTLLLPNGGPHDYDVPPPEIETIAKQLLEGFKVFASYVPTECKTQADVDW